MPSPRTKTRYKYDDLMQMKMSEVRKIGRELGLNLPIFGNMQKMVLEVLKAQDNPHTPVKKSWFSFKSKDGPNAAADHKSEKSYSEEDLRGMHWKELREYAKSLGVSVPRFGSVTPAIQDILHAQHAGVVKRQKEKKSLGLFTCGKSSSSSSSGVSSSLVVGAVSNPGSIPNLQKGMAEGENPVLHLDIPSFNNADSKSKGGKKNAENQHQQQSVKGGGKTRFELESMTRSEIINYGVSLGMSQQHLLESPTKTRLVTDIMLYMRDPKGFIALHRAKAKAKAQALKARAGDKIQAARLRGANVEIEVDRKETMERLKTVPLLAKLKPDIIELLAKEGIAKKTSEGEPVFLQGEEGDGFYLVLKGKADVIVGTDTKVGTLRSGDYFGEGALINKAPRGATVRAVTDLVCFFWTKTKFMEIFTKIYGQRNLRSVFVKRENVIATTIDPKDQTRAPVDPKLYIKSDDEKKEIYNWTRKSALLGEITSDRHFDAILRGFFKKFIPKGQVIVKKDTPALMLYVVKHGVCEETTGSSEDDVIRVLHKGSLIGELALLHDTTTPLSIYARSDVTLWCISRFTFRRLLKEVSEGELARRSTFLAQTDLCRALSSFERHTIAEALEEVEFKEGDVVMSQGDTGDCMYFLKKGDVTAFVDGQEVEWKNKEIIGEIALSTGAKRAATVKATETPTVLMRLSKLAVETLLGPVKDFLAERAKDYNKHSIVFPWGGTFGMRVFGTKVTKVEKGLQAERLGVQVGWIIKSVNGVYIESFDEFQQNIDTNSENTVVFEGLGRKNDSKNKVVATNFNYKLNELRRSVILGKGSFGSVWLVKSPEKKTYALKCVSKRIVLDTKQSKHIVSEKQVLQKMNHPFIIKLFATYKDSRYVYFVLELCLGGELFGLVQNKGGSFSEAHTCFYTANMVSIFEYMHSLDIIYRDLKPENLLVDEHGYLKLVDFGFAKEITGNTYTLCGTPDYLAPEIIKGWGHGKGVDWWCLGIFTYELISSYAPFYAENPKHTYKMICSKQPITYPPNFSSPLKDLLGGLLKRKSSERLGVIEGGSQRIKSHPWFKGINWQALAQKKIKAPYINKIGSDTDASHFDDYSDDDEAEDCGQKPTGSWEDYFG
mmetsp:Transcript_33607/g.54561  ORF Transcript_33607/g.54561 Transcript_33607/m.54561 type:complete len:1117 (-) Transcript_33607:135-3485(-)